VTTVFFKTTIASYTLNAAAQTIWTWHHRLSNSS